VSDFARQVAVCCLEMPARSPHRSRRLGR
jgi:hypothetical protein